MGGAFKIGGYFALPVDAWIGKHGRDFSPIIQNVDRTSRNAAPLSLPILPVWFPLDSAASPHSRKISSCGRKNQALDERSLEKIWVGDFHLKRVETAFPPARESRRTIGVYASGPSGAADVIVV